MNPKVKNTLKFLFFLSIGIGLIYLIVHGISPEDRENIKQAALKANYFWVLMALIVSVISHWLRAMRWKMLIEPTGKVVKTSNTFFSLMIGYMANYAPLPRLGEVYRCVILSRYEKTPFTALLGTVIVERTVDFLSLVVLFFLMLLLCFNQVYGYVKNGVANYISSKLEHLLHFNMLIGIIALVVLVVIAFVLIRKKDTIKAFAGKYIKSFVDGIKSVGKLKKPFLFWGYTVAIWICYLFAAYFCFFCFEESSHLTPVNALVVLIAGTLGVIVTPGGTGAYQVLVTKVLTRIFFISFAISFTIAWIIWGCQLLLSVILGLLSLILLPILNKNEEAGSDTVQNS